MSGPEHEGEDSIARAEAIVDRVVSGVATFGGGLIGRAREEVEDMWAEAKDVRRRGTWSMRQS
jgi:hypothetical protein